MLEMKLYTKFIKKIFFYSILFTGIVLSSMIFDDLIDTKDDSGYLIAVGICSLTFFILEYLLPKLKN